MSVDNQEGQIPQQGGEAGAQAPAGEQPASGLPSDNPQTDFSGFELNDDLKGKFKDGKLNGRFGSIDEVLDKLKETEDKYANTVRDMKAQQTESQAEAQAQQLRQQTVLEMIPAFVENNMELTAEMEAKATEAGIDVRDLKLGAIELRDKVTAAHQVVGGKDNYDAMLAWGAGHLTEQQMKDFDIGVTNAATSQYAIKGLYAEFQQATGGEGQPAQQERIAGQPAQTGVKPYADQKELFRDRQYLQSAKGKRDSAAQARYKQRLAATPDDVIYGR